MWLASVVVSSLLVWLTWKILKTTMDGLPHIPGPRINILWELLFGKRPDKFEMHRQLASMAKQFGPVFKLPNLGGPVVFVSGLDALLQVFVHSDKDFGGRDTPYRMSAVYKDTGIVFSRHPDKVWKTLRMTVQRHLKQFGEGMSKLEDIIVRVSDEVMFSQFASKINEPFSPKDIIRETSLRTVNFLICGELPVKDNERAIIMIKHYFELIRQCHPAMPPLSFELLDTFPWLRYFGVGPGHIIDEVNLVKQELWKLFDDNYLANPQDSILKVFRDYQNETEGDDRCIISEVDIISTCVTLIVAGSLTTTDTFDTFMGILAHYKNVQDMILAEIKEIAGDSQVKLVHRNKMHYTRATLLETLRFSSTVGLGVGRIATADAELQGYRIPKNTRIITNIWQLHHDPEFWGDPEVFRPERFLDDQGEVVAADHKYRRHLMPFGAGLRVCVAESLAMSRLFLWISSLVQRFEVLPAPGNDRSSANSDSLVFDCFVHAKPFEIILKNRY